MAVHNMVSVVGGHLKEQLIDQEGKYPWQDDKSDSGGGGT
jgi:hypothetical protein